MELFGKLIKWLSGQEVGKAVKAVMDVFGTFDLHVLTFLPP